MRLNIGSGGQVRDGWTGIDLAPPADLIHDLREPLPFDDASVEWIAAHHVLDLLDWADIEALIIEMRRVLRPDGVLRMSSVDIDAAADAMQREDHGWFAMLGHPEWSLAAQFQYFVTLHGARRSILFGDELAQTFLASGFGAVIGYENGVTGTGDPEMCALDSRADESWFWEVR